MPASTSQKTITLVLLFLGAAALVLLAGAFTLLALSKPVPETVWTLTGTTIGALASLLVSTRSTPEPTPIPGVLLSTAPAKYAPTVAEPITDHAA